MHLSLPHGKDVYIRHGQLRGIYEGYSKIKDHKLDAKKRPQISPPFNECYKEFILKDSDYLEFVNDSA